MSLLRLLFQPAPQARFVHRWEGPLLYTSEVEDGVPWVFSPGFGSSLFDYDGLASRFARRRPVVRVGHPGSDRLAALPALARLVGYRALGWGAREAAVKVRSHLHRSPARERRVRQLRRAVQQAMAHCGTAEVDLAGHSFGTDTALLLALRGEVRVRDLWLFSPHPPGYLISRRAYAELPVRRVHVVVGSRDWTRDGVGPFERSLVREAVGKKARLHVLRGLRHMDFALAR